MKMLRSIYTQINNLSINLNKWTVIYDSHHSLKWGTPNTKTICSIKPNLQIPHSLVYSINSVWKWFSPTAVGNGYWFASMMFWLVPQLYCGMHTHRSMEFPYTLHNSVVEREKEKIDFILLPTISMGTHTTTCIQKWHNRAIITPWDEAGDGWVDRDWEVLIDGVWVCIPIKDDGKEGDDSHTECLLLTCLFESSLTTCIIDIVGGVTVVTVAEDRCEIALASPDPST